MTPKRGRLTGPPPRRPEGAEVVRFLLLSAAICYADCRGEPVEDRAKADLEMAALMLAAALGWRPPAVGQGLDKGAVGQDGGLDG
jgi:hypothetical protein